MEASNAVKMLEDTIKLGKIGMPLLSKEGMENRLKMHEALQKAIEALEIVNKAEAIMPEKAKGKEGLHGEALRTSIRDTAVRNQAISDCKPAFAKLLKENKRLLEQLKKVSGEKEA